MTDKPELYLVNLLRRIPNTTANISVCHAKMLQAANRIEALEAEVAKAKEFAARVKLCWEESEETSRKNYAAWKEATARAERLEGENASSALVMRDITEKSLENKLRAEAAEARAKRLRAALERIASYGNAAGCNPASFTEMARKALEDDKQ
jgi:hypothetical protein